MWIATIYGWFSVTQSQLNPGELMVRARQKQHLTKLIAAFPLLKGSKINDWSKRDYRWRIFVDRADWKRVLVGLVDKTDFSNFKNAVKDHKGDGKYLSALHSTWSVMANMQESPPYGHGEGATDQQMSFHSYNGPSLECSKCGELYPDDGAPCFCGAKPKFGNLVTITAK